MKYTTNYRLIKPGQNDYYNIDDQNENMDNIDKQLKKNQDDDREWAVNTFSNPNILINGDFQVWQRGTVINTSTTKYTADRWLSIYPGLSATRQINTSPAPCMYCMRAVRTSEQGQIRIAYAIENCEMYSGKTMSLSLYIRGIGGLTGNLSVSMGNRQGITAVLDSKWQKITITKSDVTFAKDDITRQGILFATYSDNAPLAGQGFEIAAVKLELGDKATPFVSRTYNEELALCQRYYVHFGAYHQIVLYSIGRIDTSFSIYDNNVPPMRAVPTVKWESTNPRNKLYYNGKSSSLIGTITCDVCHNTYMRFVVGFPEAQNIEAGTSGSLQVINMELDAEIY